MIGTAILVAPLLVVWATWSLIQARLGPPTKFDSAGTAATLDTTILREYVWMLIGRSEYAPGIGMFPQRTSFVIMNAAMVTALICIAIARGGERSRVILAAAATLVITQLVFVIGIYALIVGPFEGRFLSFPRYTSTMLTAASVLLALVAANDWPDGGGRRGAWARAVACACAGFPGPELPVPSSGHVRRRVGEAAAVQASKLEKALGESDFPERNPVVALLFPLDSPGPRRSPPRRVLPAPGHRRPRRPPPADRPAASEAFPPSGAEQPPAYKQNVPTPAAEFARYLIDEDVRFVLVAQDNPALVGSVRRLVRPATDGELALPGRRARRVGRARLGGLIAEGAPDAPQSSWVAIHSWSSATPSRRLQRGSQPSWRTVSSTVQEAWRTSPSRY